MNDIGRIEGQAPKPAPLEDESRPVSETLPIWATVKDLFKSYAEAGREFVVSRFRRATPLASTPRAEAPPQTMEEELARLYNKSPAILAEYIDEIFNERSQLSSPEAVADHPEVLTLEDLLQEPKNLPIRKKLLELRAIRAKTMSLPTIVGAQQIKAEFLNTILKHLHRLPTVQKEEGLFEHKQVAYRAKGTFEGETIQLTRLDDHFETDKAYPSDMDLGQSKGMEKHVANLAVVYGEDGSVVTTRHARLVGPTHADSQHRLREALFLILLAQWEAKGKEGAGFYVKEGRLHFLHDFTTHLDTSFVKTLVADNERDMLMDFIQCLEEWPIQGLTVTIGETPIIVDRPMISHQMASATLRLPAGFGSGRTLSREINRADNQRRFVLTMEKLGYGAKGIEWAQNTEDTQKQLIQRHFRSEKDEQKKEILRMLYGVLTGEQMEGGEMHAALRLACRLELSHYLNLSHSCSCRSGIDRTPMGPTYQLAQDRYRKIYGKSYPILNRNVEFPSEEDQEFSRYFDEALAAHSMPMTTQTRGHTGFRWGLRSVDQMALIAYFLPKEKIRKRKEGLYGFKVRAIEELIGKEAHALTTTPLTTVDQIHVKEAAATIRQKGINVFESSGNLIGQASELNDSQVESLKDLQGTHTVVSQAAQHLLLQKERAEEKDLRVWKATASKVERETRTQFRAEQGSVLWTDMNGRTRRIVHLSSTSRINRCVMTLKELGKAIANKASRLFTNKSWFEYPVEQPLDEILSKCAFGKATPDPVNQKAFDYLLKRAKSLHKRDTNQLVAALNEIVGGRHSLQDIHTILKRYETLLDETYLSSELNKEHTLSGREIISEKVTGVIAKNGVVTSEHYRQMGIEHELKLEGETAQERYGGNLVNARVHTLTCGNERVPILRLGAITDPRNGEGNLKSDETRLGVLQPQMLQLIHNQVVQHLDQLPNLKEFHLFQVSLLDTQTGSSTKRGGMVHNEGNQASDMNEIFKKFEGKTLVLDGERDEPFLDAEGKVHIPYRFIKDGKPLELPLHTYFFNVSVQGHTDNGITQYRINKENIERAREYLPAEARAELEAHILPLTREGKTVTKPYSVARDLLLFFHQHNAAVGVNCFSGKDRTGYFIIKTMDKLVQNRFPDTPKNQLQQLRRGFYEVALKIVQQNTGFSVLKITKGYLLGINFVERLQHYLAAFRAKV